MRDEAIGLFQHGKLEEAQRIFKKILRKSPNDVIALNLSGVIYAQQEVYDKALPLIAKAVRLQPGDIQAQHNLGLMHRRLLQFSEAVEAFTACLALDSNHAPSRQSMIEALNSWAQTCIDKEQYEQAIQVYTRLLEYGEENYRVLNDIGSLSLRCGQYEQALNYFQKALELSPDNVKILDHIGTTYIRLGRPDKGEVVCKKATMLEPDTIDCHVNLGVTLQLQGKLEEALACYNHVLSKDVSNKKCHYYKTQITLLQGDLQSGFEQYEHRWAPSFVKMRDFPYPWWNGEDLHDKTLLLWEEQGIGDIIMFASFLPELCKQSKKCIIETEYRLLPLYQRSFPDAVLVERDYPAKPDIAAQDINVQSAMGSVARWLRKSKADFPEHQGYLKADATKVAACKERYAALGSGIKIGISWESKNADAGYLRSLPLEQWQPIFTAQNACFINLQYGDVSDALRDLKEQQGIEVFQDTAIDPIEDLDGFAAQIAALDLVISIDNSTVHMAGALGVPVWTLLPVSPDWRWGLDQDISMWYPSMKLFRQHKVGDWQPVVERIVRELKHL